MINLKNSIWTFILEYSKYYFIYHLNVYQGENKASIDIHKITRGLTATHEAVENTILKSVIDNDENESRHTLIDNRYGSLKLFIIM